MEINKTKHHENWDRCLYVLLEFKYVACEAEIKYMPVMRIFLFFYMFSYRYFYHNIVKPGTKPPHTSATLYYTYLFWNNETNYKDYNIKQTKELPVRKCKLLIS